MSENQVREALEEAQDTLRDHFVSVTAEGKREWTLPAMQTVDRAIDEAISLLTPAPDVPEELEAIRARHEATAAARQYRERHEILDIAIHAHTDRATLLHLLDAAREELREAEAKLVKRWEADMFWDYYDPEQPYYSVEELIQEREYEGEGIVQVQEAIRCPDAAYIYRIVDDPETDDREIVLERLSDDDHVHFRAAMSVASGARAMWDVMVDRLAAQMFAENPAPLPERMHTCQWKNLDWHYRKHHRSLAHARLAAALKEKP
jgi:hypothetical protein